MEGEFIGGVSLTNLNFSGWDKKEVRISSVGLKYKLMDLDTKKYKWLTREQIISGCVSDGMAHTSGYKRFMETTEKTEDEYKTMSGDFEKVVLKRFFSDDKNLLVDSEIIETHYPSYPGKLVSMPKLVKKIVGADFNRKTEAWGINEEILITAKKLNVEDVHLVDEYNNVHFYTTMSKFNSDGEGSSWGKVYLPLRLFKCKKYGDKVPFYSKSIKG
jgi:hypothetical protein